MKYVQIYCGPDHKIMLVPESFMNSFSERELCAKFDIIRHTPYAKWYYPHSSSTLKKEVEEWHLTCKYGDDIAQTLVDL